MGQPTKTPKVSYTTEFGLMVEGKAELALESSFLEQYLGNIQLIFTSPPFPLTRKKAYGNFEGTNYVDWLANFALQFRRFLKPDGSIVIEMGNSWKPGEPAMSTLGLESLMKFLESGDFELCQQFICQNPARLPSPAQWVNVERIRVKDAFTHLWWMSPTARPKANNRNVLTPYSTAMKQLLSRGEYNSGKRPSEHSIGTASFLINNGGAIPPNVLTASNTRSHDAYIRYCKTNDIPLHPARMSADVATFFISFLTDLGDTVLDPFAGSNVTGSTAESLGRRWVSVEANTEYARSSMSRFSDPSTKIAL